MKKYYLFLTILLLNISISAHPWKPSNYVIVDTDGGIDDMRAITMLLASPDVRVLAVIASSGVLSAENSYLKVKSLLNSYYHEGIPVGINRKSSAKLPEFKMALDTKWGDETTITPQNVNDALGLISWVISAEKTQITFISLGGLTTAWRAYNEIPLFNKQVKEILWSAEGISDKKGFNYTIDKKAAEDMLKGKIPVRIIKPAGDKEFFDKTIIEGISKINNVYAKKISDFFRSGVADGHEFIFAATDETIPLFIHYPTLFSTISSGKNSESQAEEINLLRDKAITILKGETVTRNQVVKEFPDDPSFYFDDLQENVTEIIIKYGRDEWTSGILANELHRHLGVFAIIGVKMGIRAREYFNTGVDEFMVTSYAGSTPPVSCFNDGLQVSTGATPGHGLLKVINETPPKPMAEFVYLNRKIRLTLKPVIAEKVVAELKEINFIHGLDSNIYWELVRKNSIRYWLSLDRHEIFDIEEIE